MRFSAQFSLARTGLLLLSLLCPVCDELHINAQHRDQLLLELPHGHMVLQFLLVVLVTIRKKDCVLVTDLFCLCCSMHKNLKYLTEKGISSMLG